MSQIVLRPIYDDVEYKSRAFLGVFPRLRRNTGVYSYVGREIRCTCAKKEKVRLASHTSFNFLSDKPLTQEISPASPPTHPFWALVIKTIPLSRDLIPVSRLIPNFKYNVFFWTLRHIRLLTT